VDEEVRKIGAIIEQLGARFDLVLEAVTGFGGRLEALREEMVGQFTEVGRQIRFLSDRIAENRETIMSVRADLGAEMVRIGEHLGGTRVQFREEFASVHNEFRDEFVKVGHEFKNELAKAAEQSRQDFAALGEKFGRDLGAVREESQRRGDNLREELRGEIVAEGARGREAAAQQVNAAAAELRAEIGREIKAANQALRAEFATMRTDIGRELPAAAAGINSEISAATAALIKKFDTELKQTNKTVASLARKFERFDDRITVQSKDQDQRIRKLERRA
jgi:F0F1-type ATP synthase membrane subunit b/b'